MSPKTRATIEDLYKIEGKAELVNGEIVEMPPAGDEPNRASFNVAISLREYEKRTSSGRAYTDGVGFHVHLPHREAFSPDAARLQSGPWRRNAPIISLAARKWCGMWIC